MRRSALSAEPETPYVATVIERAALPEPPVWDYRPALHDRVRVDDGREGTVIGFYRREAEGVLVSFGAGESAEFLVPELEHV